MNEKRSIPVILFLTASLIFLTVAANATPATAASTDALTQLQSGLVASDQLTAGNSGYWSFYGSAVLQNAPYAHYEDASGLNVGVQAATEGQWAGSGIPGLSCDTIEQG